MKVALAQIRSISGDIQKNIDNHTKWIDLAFAKKADMIIFPELSLTAYEPQLSKELAIELVDKRLLVFDNLSSKYDMLIGIGVPLRHEEGVSISTVFFHPSEGRQVYSKQILHEDEKAVFIERSDLAIVEFKEQRIAPAICYEAFQEMHLRKAMDSKADLYLASVAKHEEGMNKAVEYFNRMYQKYCVSIAMVNALGFNDNFMSSGRSSMWQKDTGLIAQLKDEERLLICDL